MSLESAPITLREAFAFVSGHHRHHHRPQGAIAAVQAIADGETVGVAIIGRPVARMLSDGFTAELIRLCTDGTRNAPSFLHGRARQLARALGYRWLITYTLPEEGGGSMRAGGWTCEGIAGGGTWSRAERPRVDTHPTQEKLRWRSAL